MLVLVSVGAIWLSIQVNKTRRQAEAVTAISRLGGRVWYDFHDNQPNADAQSHIPKWLWSVFGNGRVVVVDFTLVAVTDNDLRDLPEHLEKLPRFRLLSFDRTNVGDATLERLNRLRNFTILNLDSTQVTDDGLKYILDMPQLKSLAIVSTDGVSGAGLHRLREHPSLRRVVWNKKNAAEAERAAYDQLVDVLRSRGGPGL